MLYQTFKLLDVGAWRGEGGAWSCGQLPEFLAQVQTQASPFGFCDEQSVKGKSFLRALQFSPIGISKLNFHTDLLIYYRRCINWATHSVGNTQ